MHALSKLTISVASCYDEEFLPTRIDVICFGLPKMLPDRIHVGLFIISSLINLPSSLVSMVLKL